MRKIFTFCLAVLFAFSISSCISGEKDNFSSANEPKFTEADYIIEFNEALLGEEYKSAGNEIKDCKYNLSFKNGEFTAYMNFGNSVTGTYSVSKDGTIHCALKTAVGEYSTEQSITGEIVFKAVSEEEIKIVSVPDSYTIKLSELNNGQWVLTSEEKILDFWPLVDGISFKLADN